MEKYTAIKAIGEYDLTIEVYYTAMDNLDETMPGLEVNIHSTHITATDEDGFDVVDADTMEYLIGEVSTAELISEINDNL